MKNSRAARVCVSGLSFWADKEFTYSYGEDQKDEIFPGARVIVPFGRGSKMREGIVTETFVSDGAMPLKSIVKAENSETHVTEENIELARRMAKKYYSPMYECLILMSLPKSAASIRQYYSLGELPINDPTKDEKAVIDFVSEEGRVLMSDLTEKFSQSLIKKLIKSGTLILNEEIKEKGSKTALTAHLTAEHGEIDDFINTYGNKARAQVRLLEALCDVGNMPVAELIAVSGTTRASVNALCERGLIEVKNEPVRTELFKEEKMYADKKPVLNFEQQNAVDTALSGMKSGEFREYLIKGVTGSGKTEIYLTLCEHIIKDGKQAIILVPEISLTPQIRARFFGRFGDNVAVIHSGLSPSERRSEWQRIKNNEVMIAVGARSAIFAPFSNLKMIIVDEEHETSYKSEMNPRYDAKDIAYYLMQKNKGTLILSSATPSICSYYKAMTGKSTLITLKKRYNAVPLPETETVDMRNELKSGNYGVLSQRLEYLLDETRKKGEKSILLLNRRGYSTFVSCRDCGYVVKCPKCEIAMTYHSSENRLKCHYCQTSFPVPSLCPECKSTSVRYFGSGTQKLEEELYKIFPSASVIRMDNDTTTAKMSHERLLKRFQNTKGSILIGTQMIAKGLDFKDVSLVGVTAADSTLFVGGYLGSEKTFSLITQVCGRAGRGDKQGRAVIQTYQPEHYAIDAAKTQDYEKFYHNEIIFRKNVGYPPFCEIINIVFTGKSESELLEFADKIKPIMTEAVAQYNDRSEYISMYGPMPCSVSKLMGKHRVHITIKCKSADKIQNSLRYAVSKLMKKAKSGITVYVDVNPVNFI